MRLSAKADYAVRATIELAAAGGGTVKGERIAQAQQIPLNFLENILGDLKHAGLIGSRRGPDGGYWLDRPPGEVSVADVIRAVDGPLASVRGQRPEGLAYEGAAVPLEEVWIALRANVRGILEKVSMADLVSGELPSVVTEPASDPDARVRR